MKTFRCSCGQKLWFENSFCYSCKKEVGYLPYKYEMVTIDEVSPLKKCKNWIDHDVCNWIVDHEHDTEYCQACRFNQTIPDLNIPGNLKYWYRIEKAKRRLIYSLMRLGLPLKSKVEDPELGLAFEFKSDDTHPQIHFKTIGDGEKVLTGHSQGIITINVAEADDVSREKMRVQMMESYRTLLGHFRHESGHYYWNLFSGDQNLKKEFKNVFGDPDINYEEAIKNYYANGPKANWQNQYISAYSTSHPWEDWAETWAHYLHMISTIETAYFHGLIPQDKNHIVESSMNENRLLIGRIQFESFIDLWIDCSLFLNDLSASMGQKYLYPFTISTPVETKMKFIHRVVEKAEL